MHDGVFHSSLAGKSDAELLLLLLLVQLPPWQELSPLLLSSPQLSRLASSP